MTKRHRAPTNDEIKRAVARAIAGKPRQLALLVKRCSVDDLASGFKIFSECYGPRDDASVERNLWRRDACRESFRAVETALFVAAGRQEGRQNVRDFVAGVRKQARGKARETTGELIT